MTNYEVELKFAVDRFDDLRTILQEENAVSKGTQQHRDTYYAHPSRDFVETKEALRVRRIDDQPLVTYKGPKLAGEVKTRIELEWELSPGDADGDKMEALLVHLGFRRVAEVIKRRESFELSWRNVATTVTLDDVEGVGKFSEIERVSDSDCRDEAQADVASLAKRFGLTVAEPRSYLSMLLELNDANS